MCVCVILCVVVLPFISMCIMMPIVWMADKYSCMWGEGLLCVYIMPIYACD